MYKTRTRCTKTRTRCSRAHTGSYLFLRNPPRAPSTTNCLARGPTPSDMMVLLSAMCKTGNAQQRDGGSFFSTKRPTIMFRGHECRHSSILCTLKYIYCIKLGNIRRVESPGQLLRVQSFISAMAVQSDSNIQFLPFVSQHSHQTFYPSLYKKNAALSPPEPLVAPTVPF